MQRNKKEAFLFAITCSYSLSENLLFSQRWFNVFVYSAIQLVLNVLKQKKIFTLKYIKCYNS